MTEAGADGRGAPSALKRSSAYIAQFSSTADNSALMGEGASA